MNYDLVIPQLPLFLPEKSGLTKGVKVTQEDVLKNLKLNIEYLNSNLLNKFGPYVENSVENLSSLKSGMESSDRVEFYQYLKSLNYSLFQYSRKLTKAKRDISNIIDKIMLDKQEEFTLAIDLKNKPQTN